MIMDFWAQQLKSDGSFDKHKRFIVKTTASSKSWDEWAKNNDIEVINTPVGFKEIANAAKKIEYQLEKGVSDIKVKDIFGNVVSLGSSPRMLFGGEESGGMIIGSNDVIKSLGGRCALAMREKSATEAIIVASALVASLDVPLWEHLNRVYQNNNIIAKYDVREDIAYYNESEPNIEKLKEAKRIGEGLRTKNDIFYLTLAIAKLQGLLTIENIREILSSTFENLDFSKLLDVKFVGDGTYLDFEDKFVEIRPSGTDAKTKAYSGGAKREELSLFAKTLGNYDGGLNDTYKKYISEDYVKSSKDKSLEIYEKFALCDEDKREFKIPDYKTTFLK